MELAGGNAKASRKQLIVSDVNNVFLEINLLFLINGDEYVTMKPSTQNTEGERKEKK